MRAIILDLYYEIQIFMLFRKNDGDKNPIMYD